MSTYPVARQVLKKKIADAERHKLVKHLGTYGRLTDAEKKEYKSIVEKAIKSGLIKKDDNYGSEQIPPPQV